MVKRSHSVAKGATDCLAMGTKQAGGVVMQVVTPLSPHSSLPSFGSNPDPSKSSPMVFNSTGCELIDGGEHVLGDQLFYGGGKRDERWTDVVVGYLVSTFTM